MRYEKKFLPDVWQLGRVDTDLLRLGFSTAYPPRTVQSLYFDTHDMVAAHMHKVKAPRRMKYRLRWYNDATDGSWWEIKEKHGQFNTKNRRPCVESHAPDKGSIRWPMDFGVHAAGLLPVCHVVYTRAYYKHGLSGVLATVDRNLGFRLVGSSSPVPSHVCVLELKYASSIQAAASLLRFNNGLHAQGFSKYMAGLSALGIL